MRAIYFYVPGPRVKTASGDLAKTTADLIRAENVDVSINWDKHGGGSFPYRMGDQIRIKIYDPGNGEDIDRDAKAWYLNFVAVNVEIIDSDFYLTGFATTLGFPDIAYATCEEDHEPWQHDGVCRRDGEFVYDGPVEVRAYNGRWAGDETTESKIEFNKDFFKSTGAFK